MRSGLVVVALALLANHARAENAKLVRARAAIGAVQYDAAQKLLVDALDDGGNSPAEVAEIYRLSASTAVVLDRRELAEQYYRRWLALDPGATLSSELAPKIREPFVRAQAFMNAHGRLIAKASRTATAVVIVVESDPLNMAVAAAIDRAPPIKLDANRRTTLAPGARAAILDEHGNHLIELDVPAAVEPPVVTTAPPIVAPPPSSPRRLPTYRRGLVWTVAAGAVFGGALVFGTRARAANTDVTLFADESSDHTFAEFEDARSRRDRYALVANALFATSGVLAVTAAIMFATQPKHTVIAPIATGDGAGVTFARRF